MAWVPMICSSAIDPFDSDDHSFEVKWRGVRGVIESTNKGIHVDGRKSIILTPSFPELVKSDIEFGTVLDSEIIVFKDGKDHFPSIQKRLNTSGKKALLLSSTSKSTAIVFDILQYKGLDVRQAPLLERKDMLNETIQQMDRKLFIMSETIQGKGLSLFDKVKGLGMEGIVAKRVLSRYSETGEPSPDWLKIKVKQRKWFNVVGYRESEHGIASLAVADESGYRGTVGSGLLNLARRKAAYEVLRKLPSISAMKDDRTIKWVKSSAQVFVEYCDESEDNHLIHPVLLDVR